MLKKNSIMLMVIGILLFTIGGYAPFARGQEEPKKLVGDVIDFALKSDKWAGEFGWVTFRLQEAFYQGDKAYFIRTDASDKAFAKETSLIFAPRLKDALTVTSADGSKAVGDLYLFKGVLTSSGQVPLPVLSSVPGQADYSPLWQIRLITRATFPEQLTSVQAIEVARRAGQADIQTTEIVVNYPVVKWPGGELSHDTKLQQYLGEGQLIAPVDLEKTQVTFKLQQCFPGMRYIVTDVSMGMGARMMNIAYSPRLARLQAANKAMSQVYVFGNGLPGGGPMGFQSSLMDPPLGGQNLWTPLWDHFTLVWKDPTRATLVTDFDQMRRLETTGQLQQFNGTPDTHPQGFVVNCPVPVGVEEEGG